MKFVIKKEDLYNGIKIVERATSVKAIQPVLLNIYIETVGQNSIKLVATDLDMTIVAIVDAQVEKEVPEPRVTKIANTKMDEAVRKRKEMEQHGKQDLKGLLGVSKQKKERTIYLFATEKKLAERGNQQEKGVVVNG